MEFPQTSSRSSPSSVLGSQGIPNEQAADEMVSSGDAVFFDKECPKSREELSLNRPEGHEKRESSRALELSRVVTGDSGASSSSPIYDDDKVESATVSRSTMSTRMPDKATAAATCRSGVDQVHEGYGIPSRADLYQGYIGLSELFVSPGC
jgi:hypothetical protein